jgi:hypothetical protein
MTEEKMSAGNIAYLAYGQHTEFKNFLGQPMPWWHNLPNNIKEAWEKAATAATEWNNNGMTTLHKD